MQGRPSWVQNGTLRPNAAAQEPIPVSAPDETVQRQREQLFRLVAKAFYRELSYYGVARGEVLTVASHLLDNVVRDASATKGEDSSQRHAELRISQIHDDWRASKVICFDAVALRPLRQDEITKVVEWLQYPEVRNGFVPALPQEPGAISTYFAGSGRHYLAIQYDSELVGIIGAENVDGVHRKLEMKKLVGNDAMRGKGIGTRATFLFLYYAFMLQSMHKVYIHSPDTNVRNLNVNSRLGFELEGILLEEFKVGERHVDVVRMALLRPVWLALFGEGADEC